MGAMLFGISNEGIFAYAMTNQSVTAASGYRIYADSLTSASGVIKGDVSELQPDYKVSHVVLPDGNTSAAEEVSYSITESGDYTFEVVYETVPEDKQMKINLDLVSLQGKETTEEKISEKAEPEENVQSEKSQDTTSEIPITEETEIDSTAIEKAAKEAKEASKSEKLTLTVTLPEAEEKADASAETTAEQEATQNKEISQKTSEIVSRSNIQVSSQVLNTSARASGYDYTTTKTWSTADFNTKWMSISKEHMDYGTNPGSTELDKTLPSKDTVNGARFRFGKWKYGEWDDAYWLQQGAAFSDISFDFTKDFSLVGAMQVGSKFGSGKDSPEATDIKIDGGLTISFIPENQVENARSNAAKAYGAAYRLGAYNTLPNSIICEYDLATDTYYKRMDHDPKNFTIFEDDFKAVGDYTYGPSTGEFVGAYPILANGNIYNLAKNGITNGGLTSYYENVTHIGISTTNASCETSQAESSARVAVGSLDTGLIHYNITYSQANQTITFTVTPSKSGVARTIRQSVSNVISRLGSNKKMKLAFTFGAAYLDIAAYTYKSSPYFESDPNKTMGQGQIEVYATEAMVNPDLKLGSTDVRWLNSPDQVAGANQNNNAYYNSSSQIDYSDRTLWPVEGDRIYAQVGFTPTTSYMPQVNSINKGTLKVSVGTISVLDKNATAIANASVGDKSLYKRTGTTGNFKWSSYNANSAIEVSNMNEEYSFRIVLQLPNLTDNSYSEYYVKGYLNAVFNVGQSKITYKIPFSSATNNMLPISRNPRFVKWNNIDYYSQIRVIQSTDNLNSLTNSNPNGSQAATGGNKSSIHYGVGYRLGSETSPRGIYTGAPGVTFGYESASMSNLNDRTTMKNVANGATINLVEDTRYILNYQVTDSAYSSKNQNLTGNVNRGISTKKRIIWNSDNVEILNGYEFYAKQQVTMSKQDFANFSNEPNKGDYYRKIAKAARAKVFKTANYDFTDLIGGDYTNTSLSGNENHAGVTAALENPGTAQSVTLQYKGSDGQICTRTIQLTIQDDTPKVVSNENGNTITDQTATKIIFDKEDYSVSATFKLANSDGNNIDLNNVSWDDIKDKIKVALYKKNGSGGSADKFYRWANNTAATNQAKESGGSLTKVDLPVTIQQNITNGKFDGTFTVTYKLLNSSNQSTSANWIQKTWEDGAQWKILAWTDSNNPSEDYSDLSNTATDTIGISQSITDVPTVTTTIELIEKSNGSLPATMFRISDVQLNDDGTELSDKRNTTTISLESIAGLTDDQLKAAQHDYYYDVHVNESNADSRSRPYTTLTQSDTKKSFNVTYLKYTSNQNSYSDVKNANTLLGSIAYPSNGKSLPQYIRFGMRADRQTGITSNQKFVGQANFKFVRKSLSGGANP